MDSKALAFLGPQVDRIGSGDYSNRIDTKGQDEIGSLFRLLAGMQRNLAERTAAEQCAADEIGRVKSALDKASTNMMLADPEDRLIYLNDAFVRMMRAAAADLRRDLPSFDAEALLGRRFADFYPSRLSQPQHLSDLTDTFSTQLKLGGHTFSLVANPVLDERGGRLGTVVEWVDRTMEVAAEDELEALLGAITQGDFSQRLNLDDKQGFFRQFAAGMNRLTSIVAGVLDDLAVVLKAVAQGDLRQQIDSDYAGRFAELKEDTNTTVTQLKQLIGTSTSTVEAGVRLVAEIGGTMETLVKSFQQVARLVNEIAMVSREQSAGVEQVNQAIA